MLLEKLMLPVSTIVDQPVLRKVSGLIASIAAWKSKCIRCICVRATFDCFEYQTQLALR